MSSRSYKSIVEYLDANYEHLSDVIRDYGLEHLFNSKGKRGITFLMPGAAQVSELSELAARDDTVSAERILDVFRAHLITDTFKTAIDFLQREAINGHGRALDVDPKRSSKAEVRLSSGGVFSPDSGFVDGSKAANLAVWMFRGELMDAKSGTEPKTAPASPPATRKRSAKPAPPPAPPKLMTNSIRFSIAAETANAYVYRLLHGDDTVDDYMNAVLGLVQYLNDHDELTRACLYGKVLPLVSGVWMADFYLILEPYATMTDSQYLVPESMLVGYAQYRRSKGLDVGRALSTAQSCLDRPGAFESAAIYRDRVAVLEAIDDSVRRKIKCDSLSQDKLVTACIDRYTAVAKTNAIGTVQGVFPAPLAAIYAADPCRKLLEDEFRHYVYLTVGRVRCLMREQVAVELRELEEKIADYLVNSTTKYTESRERLRLLSPGIASVHRTDSRRQFITELINSTNFMFIPLNSKDLNPERFPHDISTRRPKRDRIEYWSIAHCIAEDLRGYAAPAPVRKSAVKTISKLLAAPAEDMDDEMRRALEETLASVRVRKSGVKPEPSLHKSSEPPSDNDLEDTWGPVAEAPSGSIKTQEPTTNLTISKVPTKSTPKPEAPKTDPPKRKSNKGSRSKN